MTDELRNEMARAVSALMKRRKWREVTPLDAAKAVLPIVERRIAQARAETATRGDASSDTWGGIDFTAVKVLTAHQRHDIGSCLCGWGVATGDLGRSHSLHVWRELQSAGIARQHAEKVGSDG